MDNYSTPKHEAVRHQCLAASAPDKRLDTSTSKQTSRTQKCEGLCNDVKVGPSQILMIRQWRYDIPTSVGNRTFRDTPAHSPHNRFRHFELSLQSSLHPSINLLLRYRSRAGIQPFKGHTLHIKLQSQEALLEGAQRLATAQHR